MPALDSVSANVRVRVRVGKHLDAATRVKRTRRSSRFWNADVTLVSRERLFKNLVGNLIVRHSPAVLDVVPVVGVVVELDFNRKTKTRDALPTHLCSIRYAAISS